MKKKNNLLWGALIFITAVAILAVLPGCPDKNDDGDETGTGSPTGSGTSPSETGTGASNTVTKVTISGPATAPKGGYAGFFAEVEFTGRETNAKKAVKWEFVGGKTTTTTNDGTVLKTAVGQAYLVIAAAETAATLTIKAYSDFKDTSVTPNVTFTNILDTFTLTLTEAVVNSDTGIMKIATGRVMEAGAPKEHKFQIQTNWTEPVSGANYLVDDGGKLALGDFSQNLPYSAWYLMENISDPTKKGIKNVGTGNYINVKNIVCFVGVHGSDVLLAEYTPEEQAALKASQPNVSPFEDLPSFYWDFLEIGKLAVVDPVTGIKSKGGSQTDQNNDNIVNSNILIHGFTADTGGALSHETAGRKALPSNNTKRLFHIQYRYDAGGELTFLVPPTLPDGKPNYDKTAYNWLDNKPWGWRLGTDGDDPGGWGAYNFGMYPNNGW